MIIRPSFAACRRHALTGSTACYSLSLVSTGNQLTVWQRWVRQPQKIWLRRALFQVHLWSGIALGLYVLLMSVTGSVLVYRNELYRATTPDPIISKASGPRLTDDQLTEAARRLYPGYRMVRIGRAPNLDQAVDVWLRRGDEIKKRLFDPRSGSDLGNAVPTGYLAGVRAAGSARQSARRIYRPESERRRRSRSARCWRGRVWRSGGRASRHGVAA